LEQLIWIFGRTFSFLLFHSFLCGESVFVNKVSKSKHSKLQFQILEFLKIGGRRKVEFNNSKLHLNMVVINVQLGGTRTTYLLEKPIHPLLRPADL
jgi:hypothetical protein